MWLQTALVRLGPDLEEVDFGVGVAVVFRVADAGAGGGELDFAALEVFEVAHAVFVFEDAVDDVAEDEEFGVAVRSWLVVLEKSRRVYGTGCTYQNRCRPLLCLR